MATPALIALACWPAWVYLVRRWGDGSDEPLGVVAALSLCWLARSRTTKAPAGPWVAGLLLYAWLRPWLPPLLSAAIALLLVTAACSRARHGRILPGWLGLALLSLPSLASLQFFLGYPARLSAAEAARWLLGLEGYVVQRHGLVLSWAGQSLAVDAPCSGLTSLWMTLFFVMLLASRRLWTLRQTLAMATLGTLVAWSANVLRLTGLFFSELLLQRPELHQLMGVVTFLLGLAVLQRLAPGATPESPSPQASTRAPLSFCLLVAAAGLFSPTPSPAPAFPGWPREWRGQPLQLTEEVTLAGFPGRIGRFETPQGPLLLRWVCRPSRLLHSSADCYRAAGLPFQGQEAIYDADGRRFDDISQWFWAATLGQSRGPWMAETRP